MSYPSLVASDGQEATHLCVTQVWHLLPARLPDAHQGIFQMFQGFLFAVQRPLSLNHYPDIASVTQSLLNNFAAKFRVHQSIMHHEMFFYFVPDVDLVCRCLWWRQLTLCCWLPQFGCLQGRERCNFSFFPLHSLSVYKQLDPSSK